MRLDMQSSNMLFIQPLDENNINHGSVNNILSQGTSKYFFLDFNFNKFINIYELN